MALKLIDHNSKEYQDMVGLRLELLRKPLGLKFEPEELEKEKNDVLIGAFEEEEMLGCCLLSQVDGVHIQRLRQMAVHHKLQGTGIGRQMIRFAENVARDFGCKKIVLHARGHVVGFYEKQGYRAVGEKFPELGIPHMFMEKDL
jgi:predicted GNAT family N-acyltransferase